MIADMTIFFIQLQIGLEIALFSKLGYFNPTYLSRPQN